MAVDKDEKVLAAVHSHLLKDIEDRVHEGMALFLLAHIAIACQFCSVSSLMDGAFPSRVTLLFSGVLKLDADSSSESDRPVSLPFLVPPPAHVTLTADRDDGFSTDMAQQDMVELKLQLKQDDAKGRVVVARKRFKANDLIASCFGMVMTESQLAIMQVRVCFPSFQPVLWICLVIL